MDINENDILLEYLADKEGLSVRSINICKHAELTSLKRILDFYEEWKSFMFIRNCGSKTEKELVDLCKKYQNHKPIVEIIDLENTISKINALTPIEKDELNRYFEYLISNLSIRIKNGLQKISETLNSREIFDKIFINRFNLKRIPNIGDKSGEELDKLKNDVCNFIAMSPTLKNEQLSKIIDLENTINKINALTPIKKVALNRHLEYLIPNLSVKAKNGLRKISEALNSREIFDKIFLGRFNFTSLQGIGEKTVEELGKFKNDVYNFVEILQTIQNEQLSKEHAKLIIKIHFSNLPQNFEEQLENIYDNNGKIKLFRLIELLLNSERLLNKNERRVFRFSYCNVNTEKETLESVGAELQLTRERARQIKSKLEGEIQSYFLFISNFVADDIVNYGIDNTESFIVIDKSIANKINQIEEVNFNSTFYNIIFGVLLKKTHTILGDPKMIYGKRKVKNQKSHENCYLIDSLLFECFDFEKFILDIYLQQNEKVTETYSLHFQGYVYNFIKNDGGKAFYDKIYRVCEAIIDNEFDLIVHSDGYLIFEKNTFKQLHEYCFDILNEISKPMTVEEIEAVLNEKYPFVKKTAPSIRSSLLQEKSTFINFGRTSTYALRKWEEEKENLKGGTIRDLVENYLLTQDSPKHISEITEFILQYRPDTNEKSVLTNIKIHKKKKFLFFKNSFVGLVSKEHNKKDFQEIENSKNWKSWNERFIELENFRKVKNKWPSASSTDKSEEALYNLGYRARKAFQQGDLDKEKEELLRSIGFPIDEKIENSKSWNEKFIELENFRKVKNKWPSASLTDKSEKALYNWGYKARKAFQQGDLDKEKEELLRSIGFPVDEKIRFRNSKSWDEKFIELENFRKVKNKWPSASPTDKSERALHKWGYKARKAFQQGDLDKEKEELLRSIGFPVDEKITSANNWETETKKLIN